MGDRDRQEDRQGEGEKKMGERRSWRAFSRASGGFGWSREMGLPWTSVRFLSLSQQATSYFPNFSPSHDDLASSPSHVGRGARCAGSLAPSIPTPKPTRRAGEWVSPIRTPQHWGPPQAAVPIIRASSDVFSFGYHRVPASRLFFRRLPGGGALGGGKHAFCLPMHEETRNRQLACLHLIYQAHRYIYSYRTTPVHLESTRSYLSKRELA